MKKVLFFLTIAASLFIIKDLVYSIYTLWSKKDLLVVAQRQLERQQRENLQLKASLAQVKQSGFVEEQARDKLFFVKPGERVVVLPESTSEPKKIATGVVKPNWQQWLELFH
jgi:cell division protein FtsB